MGILTKNIWNSESVCGLDLSDLSVRVVQLAGDMSHIRVKGYGSAPIPPGALIDGEVKQKDAIIGAIKKSFEVAVPKQIKTKKVICSIPETKAFLRIISIPQMNREEAGEAVKWEMEANIPLPLDQVYYDWQIVQQHIEEDKNKMNVLVVAIARSAVDQIVDLIESAGLEPYGLEIESIAQSRSLLDSKRRNKTVLIVDIGDRRTSFTISSDNVPCFTSSIPLSGMTLTDAISKGLGIPLEEAEKIKIEYGIGSDFKNDALFRAVQPVLENLVSEIVRSIDFYLSGLHYSADIDTIIICGGGARTKGIVPYLSKRVGRSILLGNPWVNTNTGKELPIIEKNSALQYSTAIGLALKEMVYGHTSESSSR